MVLQQKSRIIIEYGKIFQNRTLKYLAPALNFYGPLLKMKISQVQILAIGIKDSLVEGSYLEDQKALYFLIDKEVNKNTGYKNFKDWVQYQEYFITDYAYGENDKLQMFVFLFPPSMGDAYDKFLQGLYSKMYVKTELEEYFSGKRAAFSVLARTNVAKEEFRLLVKKEFNEHLTDYDFKTIVFEYDLPPNKSEEIFNYEELV